VNLLSEYGTYISLLPPLLKGGAVNELFAGLKDIANHTSSLSVVVEEICQQMDITLAPDTGKSDEHSPDTLQNRPRKNSLAEEKRAEVQSCSEMIRSTSVQMMRDAKEYISSKFERWDLMLGMLKNSALLVSFGGTLVSALRIFFNLEREKFNEEGMYHEDDLFWEDEVDDPKNIISERAEDEGEIVKAATLNKLIERLTAPVITGNHKFQKTFLSTYRHFTTPSELLAKLIQRYNIKIPRLPRDISVKEYAQNTVLPIQLRVINTIKIWIDTAPFDFDNILFARIKNFLTKIGSDGHTISAKQITSLIRKPAKTIRMTTNFTREFTTLNSLSLDYTKILQQFSDEQIARSLTTIDSILFVNIKPNELMGWSKQAGDEQVTNNISQLSDRFNQVSHWAVNSVLSCDKLIDRAKAFEKLIDVTLCLRRLNNFCSLFAIISGLNTVPIYRLQFTKETVSQRALKNLDLFGELMSPSGAYKNYLESLRSINPPCVPYVGVWLTQILHIDEGNQNLTNGLINFRKMDLFANIILDVQLYQQEKYEISVNQQLVSLFSQLPRDFSEEDEYALSHLREPRNAEKADIL